MHVQPPVDRRAFRKRGLSPTPLQQTVKSLASQEIKQQGKRANRRWEGSPIQMMAKEERVNPCFWYIWQQRSEEHGLPSMVCQR